MSDAPAGQNNQPETISKSEFDKVQAQNAELAKNLEGLKSQLLDTEYLSYLESKKNRQTPSAPGAGQGQNNGNIPLSQMTIGQLQQLIAAQLNQTLEATMKPVYGRINELGARQELEDVRGKYADFGEFQDKVVAILEGTPNTELSIEQAYLIAKASAINTQADDDTDKGEQDKQTVHVHGNEKPGGTVPLDGESAQRHKDPQSAASAAWEEVRKRHGLTGDTI